MTLTLLIVVIVTALLCSGAARRIAVAKGHDAAPAAAQGFLFGPAGLIYTAFRRPATVEGDALGWWQADPRTRPWAVLAGVAVAASAAFAVYQATRPSLADGHALEPHIVTWLADHDAPGATVTCPETYKVQANYTFLCSATDGTGTVQVEVTVLNDSGDVQWQLVG